MIPFLHELGTSLNSFGNSITENVDRARERWNDYAKESVIASGCASLHHTIQHDHKKAQEYGKAMGNQALTSLSDVPEFKESATKGIDLLQSSGDCMSENLSNMRTEDYFDNNCIGSGIQFEIEKSKGNHKLAQELKERCRKRGAIVAAVLAASAISSGVINPLGTIQASTTASALDSGIGAVSTQAFDNIDGLQSSAGDISRFAGTITAFEKYNAEEASGRTLVYDKTPVISRGQDVIDERFSISVKEETAEDETSVSEITEDQREVVTTQTEKEQVSGHQADAEKTFEFTAEVIDKEDIPQEDIKMVDKPIIPEYENLSKKKEVSENEKSTPETVNVKTFNKVERKEERTDRHETIEIKRSDVLEFNGKVEGSKKNLIRAFHLTNAKSKRLDFNNTFESSYSSPNIGESFLGRSTWCISIHNRFLGIDDNARIISSSALQGMGTFQHPSHEFKWSYHLGNGKIKVELKTSEGKYVTISPAGQLYAKDIDLQDDSEYLTLSSPKPVSNELASPLKDFREQDTWCIGINNRFLGIDDSHRIFLAPHCKEWEHFRIKVLDSNIPIVSIEAKNRQNCFLRADGCKIVIQSYCRKHEKFVINDLKHLKNGMIQVELKTIQGRFVTVSPAGQLYAKDTDLLESEYLTLSSPESVTNELTESLKNFHHRPTWCIGINNFFLGIDENCKIFLAPHCKECFRIKVMDSNGPIVSIEASNRQNCFLGADGYKIITQNYCREHQKFLVNDLKYLKNEKIKIEFKTIEGKFVTISPAGQLYAKDTDLQESEYLILSSPEFVTNELAVPLKDFRDRPTWCIGRSNRFLSINDEYKVSLAPHCLAWGHFSIKVIDPHGPLVRIKAKYRKNCFVRADGPKLVSQSHCSDQETFQIYHLQDLGNGKVQVGLKTSGGKFVTITPDGHLYAIETHLKEWESLTLSEP